MCVIFDGIVGTAQLMKRKKTADIFDSKSELITGLTKSNIFSTQPV